ncbi:hypothetical protein [Candidatus Nitrososphaera gargensis]|uniref:hypothetical protein n=1 Tax=Candidatus Nitrososphaera gargensis TaxID=497727 RepID=UPI00164EECC2|nr:hypothetical protein [Candidatus Nitrososphaera gargensis]
MGQINNVLIILAITLLMAVATAVLAYFADFLPLVFDSGTQISTNVSVGTQQVTTTEG